MNTNDTLIKACSAAMQPVTEAAGQVLWGLFPSGLLVGYDVDPDKLMRSGLFDVTIGEDQVKQVLANEHGIKDSYGLAYIRVYKTSKGAVAKAKKFKKAQIAKLQFELKGLK
jgi:hypothetical protein